MLGAVIGDIIGSRFGRIIIKVKSLICSPRILVRPTIVS